jgi:hypothetical protein
MWMLEETCGTDVFLVRCVEGPDTSIRRRGRDVVSEPSGVHIRGATSRRDRASCGIESEFSGGLRPGALLVKFVSSRSEKG